MLRVRIIPILLWNGTTLVKGQNFENDKRSAGSPLTTIKIYNSRDVDEIVFFDISEKIKVNIDIDFIKSLTDCVNVPITIGGGIKKLSQMDELFECGADKISINSIVYENPNIINSASTKFGCQAVTVSVDVKKIDDKYVCYYNCGKKNSSKNLYDHLKECEDRGAGEIIINSISHDGLLNGYDYELIKKCSSKLNIPVIAAGGAGDYEHFLNAYKSGASALAASSIYHFTETTPAKIKKYLIKKNVPIRENFIIDELNE